MTLTITHDTTSVVASFSPGGVIALAELRPARAGGAGVSD